MTDFFKNLSPLTERINDTLKNLLTADQALFNEIGLYNHLGGGKRLRPLIFCLVTESLGQILNIQAIKLSITFELLHMATLVHDDIVDQADTRRGRPAAHQVFGVPETVLAGDYLLARAAELALSTGNIESIKIMVKVIRELSVGELIQLQARHNVELTPEKYFDITLKKTAVLIEAAASTAAIEAKATAPLHQALSIYGRRLGLAFQIMDDILDYQESKTMGKPVGHDLDEGKITLPFILARDRLPDQKANRLKELGQPSSRSTTEIEEIRALIVQGQGVPLSLKKAESLIHEAVEALALLPESQSKENLIALAWFTVNRNY